MFNINSVLEVVNNNRKRYKGKGAIKLFSIVEYNPIYLYTDIKGNFINNTKKTKEKYFTISYGYNTLDIFQNPNISYGWDGSVNMIEATSENEAFLPKLAKLNSLREVLVFCENNNIKIYFDFLPATMQEELPLSEVYI